MTPRRALVAVCLGLVLAAAALWAASASVWYRTAADVPLRGPVEVAFTGAQVMPSLSSVALVVLGAVAAVPAVAGPVRRMLGAVLALGGGVAAVAAVDARLSAPFATDDRAARFPELPPGVPLDALLSRPTEVTAAPLLAVLGGVLVLAAGLFLAVREPSLPRFGARYAAPGARPAPVDPDRAAWRELDSGRDPTA